MKRKGVLSCAAVFWMAAYLLTACAAAPGVQTAQEGIPDVAPLQTASPARQEGTGTVESTAAPTEGPTQAEDPAGTGGERSPGDDLSFAEPAAYEIRRTALDALGREIEIYFERPVFEPVSEGYQKINAALEQRETAFFTDEEGNPITVSYYVPDDEEIRYGPYYYTYTASVTQQTDSFVSVVLAYEWYMGGVLDYGYEGYVFLTDSGNQANLTDLIDETPEAIKGEILAQLAAIDAGTGMLGLELVEAYALEDFDFYIQDNTVYVVFDKYEIAAGANGAVEIALPMPLRMG